MLVRKKNLRKFFEQMCFCISIFFVSCVEFPTFAKIQQNETWQQLPESSKLNQAQKSAITSYIEDQTYFDAVVAVQGNEIVYSWGEVDLPFNCASVRKSIFSALYGIAADSGLVDLDATLEELGVDDSKQPLTDTEKSATIRDLLQARSGIYVRSSGESDGMIRRKPERGEYAPGEHFYYNNFDFNSLPIILEQITGKKVGELIYEWLAVPTGMKGFHPENVTYQQEDYTDFDQTRVYMSAEDLIRISMVYLDSGRWQGEQIVPEDYALYSVQTVSHDSTEKDLQEIDIYEGYAYLWWVDEDENTFWANGSGGQFMIVDRANDLVVVTRNNTGLSGAGYFLYSLTERYETEEHGNDVYKRIRKELGNE